MKTLLKVNGTRGLFLWIDYGMAKLVVATILDGAQPGDIYQEETNAWERGEYYHFWSYGNDTLEEALKSLK